MTAIRVVFDGKTFVPQQPVSLPAQSEALVIVEGTDRSAQEQLDTAVRAYYEGQGGSDAEDDAWGDPPHDHGLRFEKRLCGEEGAGSGRLGAWSSKGSESGVWWWPPG
jgi:hypothetical protein